MPSLADLQQDFGTMLLTREAPSLRTLPPESHKRLDAGLTIYRNNVLSSLTDALRDTYPVVEKLVGDAFFKASAHEYVRAYPTAHPVLTYYGEHFAQFLKDFEPAKGLPYLPDMARLEYAWLQAYHASSASALNVERLQSLPPEMLQDVRFQLHPSVQLVASDYPLFRMWQANSDEAASNQTISLDDPGECVLIIRPSLKVTVRMILTSLFQFLQHIHQGETLTAAFETALARDPTFDLQAALQMCLAQDVIADVILPEEGIL